MQAGELTAEHHEAAEPEAVGNAADGVCGAVQLRRPESSNSTVTAERINNSSLDPAVVDPALLPVDGANRSHRRAVIRVSRPVVSEGSLYVVFSVYRDQLPSRWAPYLGGGIGYANLGTPSCSAGDCYSGGSAGAFAWQAKLGVAYRATERGSVFLEGGYLGATGSTTVDDVTFDGFGAWRLNLGWRQRFGGAPSRNKVVQAPAEPAAAPAMAPEPTPAPAPAIEQSVPIRGLW